MTYSWTYSDRERFCAIINCHNASINHSTFIVGYQPDGRPKYLLLAHYACEASCGLHSVAFITGEQHFSVPWRLFPLPSFPSSVWIMSFLFSFLSRFDSLHSSFSPLHLIQQITALSWAGLMRSYMARLPLLHELSSVSPKALFITPHPQPCSETHSTLEHYFLFLSHWRDSLMLHGSWQHNQSHCVCSPRTIQQPSHPGSTICNIPGDLPPDPHSEPADAAGDQDWFPAPHTHVLLPQSPLLPGCFLFLSHCA